MIEILNERFYYDGRNLRVKVRYHSRVKIGELAGCENGKGYRRIILNGERHYEHRLVWFMHYGEIPKGIQIDHINGVKDDNRIENLRLVNHQDNMKNSSKRKDNNSGIVGVHWSKHNNKWRARINVNGKRIHLGCFDNFEDAVQARKEAEIKYNFHENHGRD